MHNILKGLYSFSRDFQSKCNESWTRADNCIQLKLEKILFLVLKFLPCPAYLDSQSQFLRKSRSCSQLSIPPCHANFEQFVILICRCFCPKNTQKTIWKSEETICKVCYSKYVKKLNFEISKINVSSLSKLVRLETKYETKLTRQLQMFRKLKSQTMFMTLY